MSVSMSRPVSSFYLFLLRSGMSRLSLSSALRLLSGLLQIVSFSANRIQFFFSSLLVSDDFLICDESVLWTTLSIRTRFNLASYYHPLASFLVASFKVSQAPISRGSCPFSILALSRAVAFVDHFVLLWLVLMTLMFFLLLSSSYYLLCRSFSSCCWSSRSKDQTNKRSLQSSLWRF